MGGTDANVASAESFHTASFVDFEGQDLTHWREAIRQNASYVDMLGAVDVDRRNSDRRMPVMRNIVYMYGHRPAACRQLWFLSLYEFMVHWQVEFAEYSIDVRRNNPDFPALLTETGMEKLREQERGESVVLVPGLDYEIKAQRGGTERDWVSLPDNEFTSAYRHDWFMARNNRPKDPTYAACPMPRHGSDEVSRNAALMLTYFHPCTLKPNEAEDHVPFLGHLCEGGKSWHASLLHWFDGRVLCLETKRYWDNFLAVTRTRPEDAVDEQNGEVISDDELLVGSHDFARVVKTLMGAGRQQVAEQLGIDGEHVDGSDSQFPQATTEAFDTASRIWPVPLLEGPCIKNKESKWMRVS